MEESLVLFHYQAYSFHCESILQRLGFVTHFMPTPKQYGELCANSLRVENIAPEELLKVLQEQGIDYAEVHSYKPSRLAGIFLQNSLSHQTESIFAKIKQDIPLNEEEIRYLYGLKSLEERRAFWLLAWNLKQKLVGQDNEIGVFLELKPKTNLDWVFAKAEALLAKGHKKWLLTADLPDCLPKLLAAADFLKGRAETAVTGREVFNWFGQLKKAGVKQVFKGLNKEESRLYYLDDNRVLKEVIDLWHDGRTQMFGLSPVLPVLDEVDMSKSRQLTALLRVLFRDARIPAFNVLASLSGQLSQEEAGADLFYFILKEDADFSSDYWKMQKVLNQREEE